MTQVSASLRETSQHKAAALLHLWLQKDKHPKWIPQKHCCLSNSRLFYTTWMIMSHPVVGKYMYSSDFTHQDEFIGSWGVLLRLSKQLYNVFCGSEGALLSLTKSLKWHYFGILPWDSTLWKQSLGYKLGVCGLKNAGFTRRLRFNVKTQSSCILGKVGSRVFEFDQH